MAELTRQRTGRDENESGQHIRDVEWYQPAVESLPRDTIEFFEEYVHLRSETAIKKHIYEIRDKAWDHLPYPCIGLFRFLDFSIQLSPDYETVVQRVQQGETFLDLGCCFGQDIRRLAYDAGVSQNLIGTDVEERFMQLGYDLFADRQKLDAKFVQGDVFEKNFLQDFIGKIDIVYLGSFLHLFDDAQQKVIIKRLQRLLRPTKGAMIFGRHLGAAKGGPYRMHSIGWDLYRHSDDTMKGLFQSGRSCDGVEWRVRSSLSRYESSNWSEDRRKWQGDDTKQMMFTAIRCN